ncbi:hypothetical protein FRB94_013519 [Tulasnella sp. JGI-2019a]|nr:hypothetical protein FRB93_005134 [Tulasnella sp. JGI-2019a]KAG9014209.1 hypothetical protein FRB94_013519 [Tulasnella sp. JGI-2019a]
MPSLRQTFGIVLAGVSLYCQPPRRYKTTVAYSTFLALRIGFIKHVLILLISLSVVDAHPDSTAAATSVTQSSGTRHKAVTTQNTLNSWSDRPIDTVTEPTPSLDANPATNPPSGTLSGVSPAIIMAISTLSTIAVFVFTVWQGWQAVRYLRREHRTRMETLEAEQRAVELRTVSQHSTTE